MDDTEIEDYLARYEATLSGFDAQAAADLWGTPGMIIDDRFTGVLDDRASMAQGLERSYPVYRALGLASVGHEVLGVQHLTEAIAMVQVRWLFDDADGARLTDSTAHYLLRRDDDGIHAFVCVQTDDAEKLQALADERGLDLSSLMEG